MYLAEYFAAVAFLLAIGFGLLLLGLNAGRRQRLLADTPLSKTLGVFIGEVEVVGKCVSAQPFRSFLSERSCVLYRWEIEEEWERWEDETYTDKEGRTRTRRVLRSGWLEVGRGEASAGFYLQDEYGFLWVNPKGADLETLNLFDREVTRNDRLYFAKGPDEEISDSTGRRRFSESGLPVGTQLFVRGRASERSDIVAPQIVQDPKAEFFMITHRQVSEVGAGNASSYWVCTVLGALAVLGGCAALGGFAQPASFSFLAIYFVAWAGGWLWMVFNSLIGLRNRVQQAQSLIDVQLKRRADLIPALVACLKGFRQYEADLQVAVATLRGQTIAGARIAAAAPSLRALVERYPELKAEQSFQGLLKNLTETEDRIALARAYANDITTFYNTRLERLPDTYVARLVAMQPGALFVAEGFERAPVNVNLQA